MFSDLESRGYKLSPLVDPLDPDEWESIKKRDYWLGIVFCILLVVIFAVLPVGIILIMLSGQ